MAVKIEERALNIKKKEVAMIYVIATIRVKAGHVKPFLGIFNANVPKVRQEEGCREYFPALDLPTSIPPQHVDENEVTVIEKWASLQALEAHLAAPHMMAYREKVKDLVESVVLKVLQEA